MCTWQIQPRPGYHVPVFCTDLNLFYSIHFPFFIALWIWMGTLQDCHHAQCLLLLPSVIRMRLVNRQSNLPACLPEVQLDANGKHCLVFMSQDWLHWQIKRMKSVSVWIFSKELREGRFFIPESLISGVFDLGQARLVWKWLRSRIWQLSHSSQTGLWECFPSSLALNSEAWRWNVDLRQKWYIMWSQCS